MKSKATDENLRLMTEAIEKQLEKLGINVMDLVPDADKLLKAIKAVENKKKNIPDKV